MITGRHWYRISLEDSLHPIELHDDASGLPVFSPANASAQIPVFHHGAMRTAIVCCGPGAHLPERESR